MRLVDKHFSRQHNSKIMKNLAPSTTKSCNCRRKTDCPMDGNCLSENLIYKASVSTTTIYILYIYIAQIKKSGIEVIVDKRADYG